MAVLLLIVALAACGVAYQTYGARRRPPPPGDLAQVNGHRLHVHCRGHADPLVVLESAIAASSLSWSVVQPAVAAFARTCAYDRAGLGWSDPPSYPRTFSRMVDDLAGITARAARGAPRILVGHSFGTFLVLAYATRHPRDVAGLVLIDPPLEWLTMTPERRRMLRGAVFMSRVGAVLATLGVVRLSLALLTGGAPGAPRRFVRIFGPTTARTLERLVGEVRKLPADVHPLVREIWCQPKSFVAMAGHFAVLARERATLASLAPPADVPTVVISSGGQSDDLLAAHAALARASRRGRHLVSREVGHWVQFDEPGLVIAAIRDLVESASTR
jgi:pimeloyl-ACP methyl ester carboxylesterase